MGQIFPGDGVGTVHEGPACASEGTSSENVMLTVSTDGSHEEGESEKAAFPLDTVQVRT